MAEPRADPRALAWEILRRVDETGAFADVLLGHRLASAKLERRDQALATQLVYGTLAWRGFLDLAIETFAGRPSSSVEAPLRSLLELALFQLFRLDRVPAYAAVASAVELAKSHQGGRGAGFVNAVLRRAAREGAGAVAVPERTADLAGHLAAVHSHPRWLVERWLAESGTEETEAVLAADNEPAPTVLRVNRRALGRDDAVAELRAAGVDCRAGRFAPQAVVLASGHGDFGAAGVRRDGFTHQGEASQLVTHLLDPQPGDAVLDACAGAGGKATHIAEFLAGDGAVLALDLHHHSLARLRAESLRLGLDPIAAARADARRPPLRREFDRILLDAPCSGLGTLRQHPEIRWRRTPADVAAAARLQRSLLTALAGVLRPGGVLVYAVCTIARDENDDVVERVLAERADLRREDARAFLPPAAQSLVDAAGALRTSPRLGLDGFYAVRLKRS